MVAHMKKTFTTDQVLEIKAQIIMLKARIAAGDSTYTDEFELDELVQTLAYDTRMKAFQQKGFTLIETPATPKTKKSVA